MSPLFSEIDFVQAKDKEKLPLNCENCNNIFYQTKHNIRKAYKKEKGLKSKSGNTCQFCSHKCKGEYKTKIGTRIVTCKQCNKEHIKCMKDIKKYKNQFCSQSCSGKYHNSHKEHGCRISKLEIWIQNELLKLYPNIEFVFNNVKYINSELDIYIPELKLAFELNGIFHYEPIYGKDKLKQTQNNDNRKFQACIERGIELCIIDTSQQKQFKENTSQKYLDIITNIINMKQRVT